MIRSSGLTTPPALAFLFALVSCLAPGSADAGDPLPRELRAFAHSSIGGTTGGFEPILSDTAFLSADADGELPNAFDFSAHAPVFATQHGGREAFALSFSGTEETDVRALNFGAFTFGTRVRQAVPTFDSELSFGPDSFMESFAGDSDVAAFLNWDLVNDRTRRFGFDLSVSQRSLQANGFSTEEETSSEVGASFSGDVLLTSRLAFTGRAGINLSQDATRAHFDATARKGTRLAGRELSFAEADTGFKDAYVQGGLSFSVTKNFEIDATVGYARDLDTKDDALLGKIGAAWKLRF